MKDLSIIGRKYVNTEIHGAVEDPPSSDNQMSPAHRGLLHQDNESVWRKPFASQVKHHINHPNYT